MAFDASNITGAFTGIGNIGSGTNVVNDGMTWINNAMHAIQHFNTTDMVGVICVGLCTVVFFMNFVEMSNKMSEGKQQ